MFQKPGWLLLGPATYQRLSKNSAKHREKEQDKDNWDEIWKHRKRPLCSRILQSLGKDNGRSEFTAVEKEKEEKKKKKGQVNRKSKVGCNAIELVDE